MVHSVRTAAQTLLEAGHEGQVCRLGQVGLVVLRVLRGHFVVSTRLNDCANVGAEAFVAHVVFSCTSS